MGAPIRLTQFAGIAPNVTPRLLGPAQAQVAVNTRLWDGSLQAYRAPITVAPLAKAGVKRTIYRWGRDRDESGFWMHWTSLADIVRAPYALSTTERTYFTVGGELRVTDATMVAAGGGTVYPNVSRLVGVAPPSQTPIVVVTGTAATGETPVERFVVYTFVNEWGEESAPSPISSRIVATASQTINVSNMEVPSGEWPHTSKRIYISEGTGASAQFFFRFEVGIGQPSAAFSASLDAAPNIGGGVAVGEPLATATWLRPPAGAHSLGILPGNVLFCLADMQLCFSEPNFNYAWPPGYRITFPHKPIAARVLGNAIVVLTEAFPYIVAGVQPGRMQDRRVEIKQACTNAASAIEIDDAVGFASPDGYHLIDGASVQSITESYFNRDQWQAYRPESMVAAWWDKRVVIAFDTGTRRGILLVQAGAEPVELTVTADAMWVDPVRDALYIANGAAVQRFDAGTPLTATWRGRIEVRPKPGNYSLVQLVASAYPVTMRLYGDGVLRATKVLQSRRAARLPAGYDATDHEFEIEMSAGRVTVCTLVDDVEELRAV